MSKVGRALKIAGILIIISGVMVHFYKDLALPVRSEADIFYWLPNMFGLSVMFFGDMINENRRMVKFLVFNNAACFFLMLTWCLFVYGYVPIFINTNIVIRALEISTIIQLCLLLFTHFLYKMRPQV